MAGVKDYRDVSERFVNEGKCFFSTYNAAVGGGLTANMRIATAAGTQVHLIALRVECDQDSTIILEENTAITGAGTGISEFNRDRRTSTTRVAQTLVEHTATLGAAGTVLFQKTLSASGEVDPVKGTKFILKPGEDYVLKVTDTAGGHNLTVTIIWYEVV